MRYFGIINKEEIEEYSIGSTEIYLAEKNCYNKCLSEEVLEKIIIQTNFDKSYSKEIEVEFEYKPDIKLLNEFYSLIFKIYKYKFINLKYNYFLNFEKETFGFEDSEKRLCALKDFNEIFNSVNPDVIEFIGEKKLENGTLQTEIYSNKMYKLYMYQLRLKQVVGTTTNMINFLTGNKDFYDDIFYADCIDIQKVANLGVILEILIELNNRYNFEDDKYFTGKFARECKFQDYEHVFKSLLGYEFTNEIFNTNDTINKATVESLYEVLTSQDLIYDHKENFIEFVFFEYKLKMSKIISYSYKENWDHDVRVLFFNMELQKMKLKNQESTGIFDIC